MKISHTPIVMTMTTALLLAGSVHASPSYAQHGDHGAPAQTAAQPEPAAEAPTVEIPLEKQQLIGITTVVVGTVPMRKTVRTVGRVEYDERRFTTVNAKFEGWIEKLYADYTGKQVRKGEPLAEIYSPELLATQQELLSALRWRDPSGKAADGTVGALLSQDAEALITAARQRLRLWDMSSKQINAIERSGRTIRTITLLSPVTGAVVQKMAVAGMRIMPGEKLFDIADLSSVWVTADIYESELPLVALGATARISITGAGELTAPVEFLLPTLAGDTRTVKARMTVPNPKGTLKPQMFATVEINVDLGKRLAVPDDAVLDTGARQIVYVDKGEGYFEPREVTLGLRAEGFREVLKGLKAGEKAARSATFLIDSEAQLKGVR